MSNTLIADSSSPTPKFPDQDAKSVAAAFLAAKREADQTKPNIPKPTEDDTQKRIDNGVAFDCRRAITEYLDQNKCFAGHNPVSNRLLELISGTDLDNESKKELTKVFIHEPPPVPNFILRAKPLGEFMKPLTNDPGELIKHRFLCKGGGLLLVGQTGHGKSSLAMQLAIKWSLGQSCFGLEPAKPIKSLIVQAENDDGDIAEMKDGVFNGLNLSLEDQERASQNIFVVRENERTGEELFQRTIESLLIVHQPDLLWIDPALSYINGDMNNQKDVGKFLRNQLNPMLVKHNCGAVIIHHTNKPIASPDKILIDPAYLGAGSAEWANWARAVLALRKTDVAELYELVAGKRGARLKWRAQDGQGLSFGKYIMHSKRPDVICWSEMALAEAESLKANNGKTVDDVLKHVPESGLVAKDELINICRKNGIGKNMVPDLITELMENGKLHEHLARRSNARPKVLLCRQPNAKKELVLLELYSRNSHGIYFAPSNN